MDGTFEGPLSVSQGNCSGDGSSGGANARHVRMALDGGFGGDLACPLAGSLTANPISERSLTRLVKVP